MTTEPLTPDAVRALIGDLHEWGDPNFTLSVPDRAKAIMRRAEAALGATLPREDADLDMIEANLNHPTARAYIEKLASQATLSHLGRATVALPGLLARVRNAETQWRLWLDRANYLDTRLASRTAETAEGSVQRKVAVGAEVKHIRLGYTGKVVALDRPWGWRVEWEDKPGESISTEPEDGSSLVLLVQPTPGITKEQEARLAELADGMVVTKVAAIRSGHASAQAAAVGAVFAFADALHELVDSECIPRIPEEQS
jgi:hypothetical protein